MEISRRKRALLDLEVLNIVGRPFFTLFIFLSFLGVFYLSRQMSCFLRTPSGGFPSFKALLEVFYPKYTFLSSSIFRKFTRGPFKAPLDISMIVSSIQGLFNLEDFVEKYWPEVLLPQEIFQIWAILKFLKNEIPKKDFLRPFKIVSAIKKPCLVIPLLANFQRSSTFPKTFRGTSEKN